jgi:hypothetical protein
MARKRLGKVSSYMRRALFVLVLMTLPGCGSNLMSVSGTVTLDGHSLAGSDRLRGTVQFVPASGHGTTAVGYLDENGRYELSSGSRPGVLPGNYLVTISATEIIPPKVAGEAPSGHLTTPRRYADPRSSGLTADVERGHNKFDYALVSR